MLRPVTNEEIATFWRDGVVCLRGILEPEVVRAMEAPVEALLGHESMADMTQMGEALAAGGADVLRDTTDADAGDRAPTGRFISGIDSWRTIPEFRTFACDSALPAIVGALLRSDRVLLWEDSVLVKEPGTREHTAWHQDLSYFHVEGTQLCTTWVPLDDADAESGAMRFVRGSHEWSEVFRPNLFVSTMAIPGTDGAEIPDIDAMAARGECEIVTYALGPGDLTVHHARTLHAAGGNRSPRRRRAISVRYCGDDARFFARRGAPLKPHHHAMHDGDDLASDDCPVVWERDA